LLEADVHEKKSLGPAPQLDPNQDGLPGRHGTFVSYDIFLQYYWPHFAQSSTKGLGKGFYIILLDSLLIYPFQIHP
jgi:hypothetical protein